MDIKIGTDPEVFATLEGKFISAHDLIKGTKASPYPVPCGAIQVDGVAMEFNTNPARTADEFIGNIESVMTAMIGEARKVSPNVQVAIEPTAYFDQEYFDNLPDTPKLLGCTPDYNAYTGKENTPPETDEPFRTGAGHIHIGWTVGEDVEDEDHFNLGIEVSKQLDAGLFPVSLLWDSDNKRRELYGKIGAFRPKHYGVEWRPMSNAYLRRKFVQRYVFESAMHLSDLLLNKGVRVFEDDYARKTVQDLQDGVILSKSEIQSYIRYMNENYGTPLFL